MRTKHHRQATGAPKLQRTRQVGFRLEDSAVLQHAWLAASSQRCSGTGNI
eukprot:SAG31_NODE_10608_length_1118_cov_1.019627_3_plen_49_part_01